MTALSPFAGIPVLGSPPPVSPDAPASSPFAEEILLKACAFNASLVARYDWLKPEHFFLKARAYIWAAMQALSARAAAPLPAAPWAHDVGLELSKMGRLKDIGGAARLADLCDEEPDIIDLDAMAESIFASWHARQIERVTTRLATEARCGSAPESLLRGLESELVTLQALSRRPDADGVSLGDAARGAADVAAARQRGDSDAILRAPTGFTEIDTLSKGGMGRGNLWILGGRPGEGKTSLALNIALNRAFDQDAVVIFSLEMSRTELGARVVASESGVPVEGDLDAEQVQALYDAADRVRRLPVLIDDTPALALDDLVRRAKRAAARLAARGKRLGLVVVDYLQLVKVARIPGRKRADEIAEVSTTLKALARELDCTVLALAQLNRESERESRRPTMIDLRDCGQIEQDADWIGMLWRQRNTPPWETDLAICKQRGGQKTADVKLGWQGHITRFSDA